MRSTKRGQPSINFEAKRKKLLSNRPNDNNGGEDPEPSPLELDTKKCLNVAGDGSFYERAASRRVRHRQVLLANDAHQAMPLKPSQTKDKKTKKLQPIFDDRDVDDPHAAQVMRNSQINQRETKKPTGRKTNTASRVSCGSITKRKK